MVAFANESNHSILLWHQTDWQHFFCCCQQFLKFKIQTLEMIGFIFEIDVFILLLEYRLVSHFIYQMFLHLHSHSFVSISCTKINDIVPAFQTISCELENRIQLKSEFACVVSVYLMTIHDYW